MWNINPNVNLLCLRKALLFSLTWNQCAKCLYVSFALDDVALLYMMLINYAWCRLIMHDIDQCFSICGPRKPRGPRRVVRGSVIVIQKTEKQLMTTFKNGGSTVPVPVIGNDCLWTLKNNIQLQLIGFVINISVVSRRKTQKLKWINLCLKKSDTRPQLVDSVGASASCVSDSEVEVDRKFRAADVARQTKYANIIKNI